MTEGIFLATAMPDPEWWEVLWPRPSEVLAGLGIEPGMEVVDLCCGDGLFTASLSGMARRVVAIDLDPKILELARARTAAAATNCDFIVGDAYDLARLVPGPVDLVLIANTFHGVPDKARLARECGHRRVALLDPVRLHDGRGRDERERARLLQQAAANLVAEDAGHRGGADGSQRANDIGDVDRDRCSSRCSMSVTSRRSRPLIGRAFRALKAIDLQIRPVIERGSTLTSFCAIC